MKSPKKEITKETNAETEERKDERMKEIYFRNKDRRKWNSTYIEINKHRLTPKQTRNVRLKLPYKTQVECVLPSAQRHIYLRENSTNNCKIYITVYFKGCEANFIWVFMYPQ